ncbi:Elongation factor P [candidate division SR1 bacterium Aalborg_AAW-1]|nr:Elongation factor P [candidate division SR1 bacterium Aalborg_AAW-1]
MKINPGEVKKGTILQIEGKLFRITDISHTHMARGGATYTFKAKDVITGKTNTFTYQSTVTLEQAEVQTINSVFLYKAGTSYSFMENDSGEMHDLEEDMIEDIALYLKDGLDVFLMKHEGNVINIILPQTITYTIESTVPGIKGDRSSAGKKPATLETGLEVQIPLHKEAGQTVVVNTITGEAS